MDDHERDKLNARTSDKSDKLQLDPKDVPRRMSSKNRSTDDAVIQAALIEAGMIMNEKGKKSHIGYEPSVSLSSQAVSKDPFHILNKDMPDRSQVREEADKEKRQLMLLLVAVGGIILAAGLTILIFWISSSTP